jgi:hypothetical protein
VQDLDSVQVSQQVPGVAAGAGAGAGLGEV